MTAAGLPVEAPAPAAPGPTRATALARDRSTWLAGVRLAAAVVAGEPSTWPIGLAGFLARGGLVLFVLPVVVLPTPTGLATIFGPAVISLALASPNPALIGLAIVGVVVGVTVLALGSLVGAVADVALIRLVTRRAGIPDRSAAAAADWATVARIVVVRLVALVPLAVALGLAVARIVGATYGELISPGDLAVPLVVRVILAVPDAVIAVGLTWLLGETVGGLAARQVTLSGRSVGASLGWAIASLIRQPVASLATAALGLGGIVLAVGPALWLAALAWDLARQVLLDGGDLSAVAGAAVVFAATWIAGLLLTGIAVAWRSALWTAEVLRRHDRAR